MKRVHGVKDASRRVCFGQNYVRRLSFANQSWSGALKSIVGSMTGQESKGKSLNKSGREPGSLCFHISEGIGTIQCNYL